MKQKKYVMMVKKRNNWSTQSIHIKNDENNSHDLIAILMHKIGVMKKKINRCGMLQQQFKTA